MRPHQVIWLSAILRCVSADWQYLSRPDLSPPRLNITVPASSRVEPGYIFVTPTAGFIEGSVGPEQPGAYIFRDDGELVWSGLGYIAGFAGDFSPTVINGKSVLRSSQGLLDSFHGRMYGDHVVLNDRYQTVSVVRAASHRLVSVHEFNVVNGKSVLVEAPVPVPADLSIYGGDEGQEWILNHGFQELDLQTGELLFEWYSLDHINPKCQFKCPVPHYRRLIVMTDSSVPLMKEGPFSGRSSFDAYNYFHLNSIDKDDEGNYLISARHYCAIFKINGTDGEILWQLGGTRGSDFDIPANVEFAFQHDARFRHRSPDGSIERISFFDNAAITEPIDPINPNSRGRYVELNHTAGTATEIHTYDAPDGLSAQSQGNFQFLPNGNKFINWGQAGAVTEYTEDGTVLFHAYLDSYPNQNVQSYRGFRSNWTAVPTEEPAVLALSHGDGKLSVWVSWNGDTETRTWIFYLVDNASEKVVMSLGTQTRTGFETLFEKNIGGTVEAIEKFSIEVEALDAQGRGLGSSRPVWIQDDAPYRPHLDKIQSQSSHATGSRAHEL
ncbi:secreted protein [Penicillium sp. IBT 18751x]|nr:secreted protein [Penicillium sp. IBT 18751x]